jgi:hypothetical protein
MLPLLLYLEIAPRQTCHLNELMILLRMNGSSERISLYLLERDLSDVPSPRDAVAFRVPTDPGTRLKVEVRWTWSNNDSGARNY